LKWIVDGAVAWHRDGLPDSEVVNLATGGYRTDMDSIGLFLADRCLTAPKLIASASDLYAAYSQWCEDSGEYVWSQKRLSSELRSRGYTTNLDARTRRANWLGIGLIAEPRRSSQESEFENSDGSWGKIP